MVAGRRLWGHNEQRASQNQACRGGYLGVEAVVENRLGSGEAGRLGTGIEAGRQVDEENHREAEQAECENDPTQAAAAFVA